MEKTMVQSESLAHYIFNEDMLGEKNKAPIKMALFTTIFECLNTLKHPLLIEGEHIYDSKLPIDKAIQRCVEKAV